MLLKFLQTSFLSITLSTMALCQQTVLGTITHDGIQRDYRLFIPSGYSATTPAPLVFNLHGFTSNALEQQIYSEMDIVAEANNFLVCYPNGIGNAWNVEWNFGSTADDVGFISSLIDALSIDYSINSSRVYSCGMSNGGFMSYRLACELNDKIAAIASVTGSMVPGFACTPDKPVPVLEIHGTSDPTVPYNGQANLCIDIDDVIDFWVNNNNCEINPDTVLIDNIVTTDFCTATRYNFNECENSKVSLIKINGGAHTWPGATFILGVTNQDIDASEEIWAFFNQFELGGFTANTNKYGVANEDELIVYPNPATDLIHVKMPNLLGGVNFEITNNISQKTMQGELNNNNQTINIGHLKPGIYYLSIKSGGRLIGKTFIKK